jgi:hypothetical protein
MLADDVADPESRPVDGMRRSDGDHVVGDEGRLDARIARSSAARGDCCAASAGDRKCTDASGRTGRSTTKRQLSPLREGSPVIWISSLTTQV